MSKCLRGFFWFKNSKVITPYPKEIFAEILNPIYCIPTNSNLFISLLLKKIIIRKCFQTPIYSVDAQPQKLKQRQQQTHSVNHFGHA